MQRVTRRGWHWAAIALTGLLLLTQAGDANVTGPDQLRLQRAREHHQREVERARELYQATLQRANQMLERQYEAVIETYRRREDAAAVDALQAELQAALAPVDEVAAKPEQAVNRHRGLIEAIGAQVVDGAGQTHDTARLAKARWVMLYFSASWCGPCRAFTPRLTAFHQQFAGENGIEVVLVSSDRTEQAMLDYMRSAGMAWPAVPYDRIGASGLRRTYGARGIPHLVALDGDGRIVSSSVVDGKYVGPNQVLNDMRQRLAQQ